MFFVDTIEIPGLGNRSHLAGGTRSAVVVDPPRDIDRAIAAAAVRGVRVLAVAETHVQCSPAARLATPTALGWALIAPFTATAVLGAWDGKRLAGKVSTESLQRIFGAVLPAVAAFMLVDPVA